jgi:hypothetical protein
MARKELTTVKVDAIPFSSRDSIKCRGNDSSGQYLLLGIFSLQVIPY